MDIFQQELLVGCVSLKVLAGKVAWSDTRLHFSAEDSLFNVLNAVILVVIVVHSIFVATSFVYLIFVHLIRFLIL